VKSRDTRQDTPTIHRKTPHGCVMSRCTKISDRAACLVARPLFLRRALPPNIGANGSVVS
jgi:hypothetical protein